MLDFALEKNLKVSLTNNNVVSQLGVIPKLIILLFCNEVIKSRKVLIFWVTRI